MALKRDLSFFDLTNIVVGAIIGSDIYIASALTARLIGPFSIVVWIVAGIIATILAMIFAYSAYYVPKVGGSFAFVSTAFDEFWGFIAGWSMWIADVLSLPVFALTFANYLQYYVQLSFLAQFFVKAVFLFGLTAVNIFGVKAAGRLNDVLTVGKLLPLLLIVFFGLGSFLFRPSGFVSNYVPLLPDGLGNFGTALVLIFWAYVGFELGVLPAGRGQESECDNSQGNNHRDGHSDFLLPLNELCNLRGRPLFPAGRDSSPASPRINRSPRGDRCGIH